MSDTLPPEFKVAARIDTFVSKSSHRVVDMWSSKKSALIHDWAVELLNMPKDSNLSILEFGCGIGEFLRTLHRNGYKVHGEEGVIRLTGVDVSEKALEVARADWSEHEWIHGSHTTNFPKGPFDYAIALGPLCYTINPDKYAGLKEQVDALRSVAAHGIGYLMITDKKGAPPGKVFARFTPEEVRELFPDCEIIVEDRGIADFVSNSGFEDYDKYWIKW